MGHRTLLEKGSFGCVVFFFFFVFRLCVCVCVVRVYRVYVGCTEWFIGFVGFTGFMSL